MKLTVLVDNCVPIGSPLLGESGYSALVECDGKRILFDAGATDLLLYNAERLGVNLLELDFIVLSHHHSDHTGGLYALADLYERVPIERRPEVVCHPDLFATRDHGGDFPAVIPRQELGKVFALTLVEQGMQLTRSLLFLTDIPRTSHEQQQVWGMVDRANGKRESDTVQEEGLLAFLSGNNVFILTGCTHCGVCNAVRHVKTKTGAARVAAVAGGLHLLGQSPEHLTATAAVLRQEDVAMLYASHCTDLAACIELSKQLNMEQLRCGESLVLGGQTV